LTASEFGNPRGGTATKTILFVCVENTFRSVLAEELFNARGPPGWHAESAGVSPATHVNPVVEPLLGELGVRLTRRAPRLVTPEMVARATKVVTFGCLNRCPIGTEGKGEDWPFPGATGKSMKELREIRDGLALKVDGLIERLAIAKSKTVV